MEVEIVRRQVIREYMSGKSKRNLAKLNRDAYILYYTILIDNIKHQYLVDYGKARTALVPATATEGMYSVEVGSSAMNKILEPYAIPVIIDLDKDNPAKTIEKYRKLALLK